MHPQQDMRDSLKHISSLLAKIHKNLMDDQMSTKELAAGGLFSPGTKLNLLLNDPDFDWLRSLSHLISLVDGGIFQKEPIAEEQYDSYIEEVKKLMFKQENKKFTDQYLSICRLRPEIMVEHRELQKFIESREN